MKDLRAGQWIPSDFLKDPLTLKMNGLREKDRGFAGKGEERALSTYPYAFLSVDNDF